MNTHSQVGKTVANIPNFKPIQIKKMQRCRQIGKLAVLPICQLAQTRMVAGFSMILKLAKTPPPTT